MRFVCIGYINELQWEKLSEQEQSQILEEYFNYYNDLKTNDKFLSGIGLKSVKEACKISLVDDVVKETTLQVDIDQIGGFFIIEADDLEEAKSIVSKHPGLKVGSFEIRTADEEITEIVGAK